MVVQSKFAPRNALRFAGDLFDVGPVARFVGIQRMYAGGTPEVFVRSSKCSGLEAICGRGGHGDRAADAGLASVIEYLSCAAGELLEREMAVRVDHGAIRSQCEQQGANTEKKMQRLSAIGLRQASSRG